MTPEQRKLFLEGVIPRRMQDLALCEAMCGILNRHRDEGDATLTMGAQGIHASDRRAFVNPILLSGVVLCRGMLDFVGIKLKFGSNPPALIQRHPKAVGSDDIVCEDFGVPPIPLAEFQKLTKFHISDGEESIAAVLKLANKDVAHLTEQLDRRWEIRRLSYACHLTNVILNGYFYACLQLSPVALPTYDSAPSDSPKPDER